MKRKKITVDRNGTSWEKQTRENKNGSQKNG